MKQQKGFTMIELLVAMSLFVIVISLASGVFVQSLRTQRAAVALIAANNNASLTLEQIAREIRTGAGFDIGLGAGTEGESDTLTFISAREEPAGQPNVNYKWNSANKSVERNSQRITSDNVAVENLKFNLKVGTPALVTIVLQISVPNTPIKGTFINIQTSVSSRSF